MKSNNEQKSPVKLQKDGQELVTWHEKYKDIKKQWEVIRNHTCIGLNVNQVLLYVYIYIYIYTYKFLLYFDFLQIFYGLTKKPTVQKLYSTRLIKKDKEDKEQTQKKKKNAIK